MHRCFLAKSSGGSIETRIAALKRAHACFLWGVVIAVSVGVLPAQESVSDVRVPVISPDLVAVLSGNTSLTTRLAFMEDLPEMSDDQQESVILYLMRHEDYPDREALLRVFTEVTRTNRMSNTVARHLADGSAGFDDPVLRGYGLDLLTSVDFERRAQVVAEHLWVFMSESQREGFVSGGERFWVGRLLNALGEIEPTAAIWLAREIIGRYGDGALRTDAERVLRAFPNAGRF